ncbi:hypothetical protein C8R45DRAFT_942616 [Mycena sanguinolenta]|nr:hypothetical protein C8R45DRAFT_942616 [Mycena sanguinolenta]
MAGFNCLKWLEVRACPTSRHNRLGSSGRMPLSRPLPALAPTSSIALQALAPLDLHIEVEVILMCIAQLRATFPLSLRRVVHSQAVDDVLGVPDLINSTLRAVSGAPLAALGCDGMSRCYRGGFDGDFYFFVFVVKNHSMRERERGSDAKAENVGIKIVVVTSRRYRIYTKIMYEILEIWKGVMATGIIRIREDGPVEKSFKLRSHLTWHIGCHVTTSLSLSLTRRVFLSAALPPPTSKNPLESSYKSSKPSDKIPVLKSSVLRVYCAARKLLHTIHLANPWPQQLNTQALKPHKFYGLYSSFKLSSFRSRLGVSAAWYFAWRVDISASGESSRGSGTTTLAGNGTSELCRYTSNLCQWFAHAYQYIHSSCSSANKIKRTGKEKHVRMHISGSRINFWQILTPESILASAIFFWCQGWFWSLGSLPGQKHFPDQAGHVVQLLLEIFQIG